MASFVESKMKEIFGILRLRLWGERAEAKSPWILPHLLHRREIDLARRQRTRI
jgi:hypothetical protein